jgi:hypothetical protein
LRGSSKYLKERTVIFYHKMSARKHVQEITSLNLFLNLSTIYYQAARTRVSKNAYLDTIHFVT